ncbi:MAG: mechanosensitive ion channel family protein [Bdellovibrionaceae bacterium]|nr:mechanosensitive ion channel family protein [Pseudobdellovibrionaceae bacterium]MDW8191187.1 mechanosensitive ion channel family protein [Pseudobdellovibrionaceae bacterium]
MKLQEKSLHEILHFEPFILISLLILLTYLFYKILLKNVSPERHKNIQGQFKTITNLYIYFLAFFLSYNVLITLKEDSFRKVATYVGLITFILGAVITVRTSRLLLLLYLFFNNLKSGVPVLLVNVFSLIVSFILLLWSLSYFFKIDVGPLLATSAAVSLVLGLALQDTLGNLFAGISLQLDRSFEIGDWLELWMNNQKVVGKVEEISWRSTTLKGLFNELIILPNRILASAQISNYKKGEIALYRSQIFRVPHFIDPDFVRRVLLEVLKEIPAIRKDHTSYCLAIENHDSWVTYRLSYVIDDFSAQYIIGNEVLQKGIQALQNAGIPLAHQIYELQHPREDKSPPSLSKGGNNK